MVGAGEVVGGDKYSYIEECGFYIFVWFQIIHVNIKSLYFGIIPW